MATPPTLALIVLEMGGRTCAVPCSDVVEIIPRVVLDPVPGSPPEVLGVVNVRGKVVSVVDIRARVAGVDPESAAMIPFQHLVILAIGDRRIGVAVDEVLDVTSIPSEDIERPGTLTGGQSPGVARIGDTMVLVLDSSDMLHALEN